MHTRPLLVGLLLAASPLTAQSVQPPFNAYYQAVDLGQMPGVFGYGGIAFAPSDPNALLVSPYGTGQIRRVPLVRDAQGFVTGFGSSTLLATVGGNDGGLAFGPGGVLFFTWYGQNRLGQLKSGSTTPDKLIDLATHGITSSVGSCAFVPPGRQGAGRCKLTTYSGSQWYDVTLAPDGNGTFSIAAVAAPVQLQGGPEGIVYPPISAPLLGQSVLIAEWDAGIAAYTTDQNGDPMPNSRQLLMTGLVANGGGAIDPVSGDMLFTGAGGRLAALRLGAVCGTATSYGPSTPCGAVTPALSVTGCARLGQVISLRVDGPPNGFGVLALGSYATSYPFQGLTVLNNLEVLLASQLGSTGAMVMPLAIPPTPGLGDAHFYLQAAYLHATTPSGLCATAGLDFWIR